MHAAQCSAATIRSKLSPVVKAVALPISGECCSVRLKRERERERERDREIRVTAVNVLGPHNHRTETNVADGQPTGQSRLGWPWEQHWSQFEEFLPPSPPPMENLR